MTICKKCGLRWESIEDTPEEKKYRMCWRCIEEARKNGEIPPKKEQKSFNDFLYEYFDKKIKEIKEDVMTEKRFELKVNQHNQYDIVDWMESKEKNAICIYNDLGNYYFSSAKALCELLNNLHEKNKQLQERNDRQYKQLDDLYRLIEEKDWRALTDIVDDFKKNEKQLQKEWKCYK